MLRRSWILGVIVSLSVVVVGNALAKPGRRPIAPRFPVVQKGVQQFALSSAPLTLTEVRFVGEGFTTVACASPQKDKPDFLGAEWTNQFEGRSGTWQTDGKVGATLSCEIPAEAQGVTLKFCRNDEVYAPVTLSLNGSTVALPQVHKAPREVLVRLDTTGKQPVLTGEPALNYWTVRRTRMGDRFDESEVTIATEDGNDPLTCGEYRAHVSYVTDPGRIANPAVPLDVNLNGLDITPYDGYLLTVKAPDCRKVGGGLKDSVNFSWRGGGGPITPGEWTSVAVPFEIHSNYTTAGDGVLKLSEIKKLGIGVGGRPRTASPQGEYVVAAPRFYKGAPPEGVYVAQKAPRSLCAVVSLDPQRRQPQFFEGVSVQSFCQQGDFVWLGTDHGIVKCSVDQPGLPMAQYGMAEGLVDDDVHAVYADGKDLWIGTTCGLSRFDGKEFQNFTSADGLLPGPVMAIDANEEAVWLGQARGVAKYDKSSGQFTAKPGRGGWAPESTGGQGVPIQEGRGVYADSMAVDVDGSIWHGAAGMKHFSCTGQRLGSAGGSTTRVLAIYPADDKVWWVTSKGLTALKKDDLEEKVASFGVSRRKGIGGERHSAFITCAYPQQGGVWLGYSDGVGWVNLKDRNVYWSPAFSIALGSLVPQSIFADAKNVWVGTDNGLMVFPKDKAMDSWKVLEYSAPNDLWAAGVDLNADLPVTAAEECEEGCDDDVTSVDEVTPVDVDAGPRDEACFQEVMLDDTEGAPNSPGALLLNYALDHDGASKAVLAQKFNLELSNCRGISFCGKTDAPAGQTREFQVDVTFDVQTGKRIRPVTLRHVITLDNNWRQFKVPFAEMKVISSGPTPRGRGKQDASAAAAIHMTGVYLTRGVGDFGCAGESGKLWVDRLAWLTGSPTAARRAQAPTRRG